MKIISGQLNSTGKKFAVVVSRFNEFITNKLVSGSVDMLVRHGAKEEDITTVWVPGAFEISTVAKNLQIHQNMMLLFVWAVLSEAQHRILITFLLKFQKESQPSVYQAKFL